MRYFGTDGIRGKADELLQLRLPYLLGAALSAKGGKILVARDVRTHSFEIENQLTLGMLQGGDARIWLAGVLPTPALAYVAEKECADFAVMITASHNPPMFNGLKVFGRQGKKLSPADEEALDGAICRLMQEGVPVECEEDIAADTVFDDENYSALELKISERNHRIRIASGAEEMYRNHILSMFPSFEGMAVTVDAAHGCFASLAKGILERLGASVRAINDDRNGQLVNVNCGSTHIDGLAKFTKMDEIGFAFDGDGDRLIAVVDKKPYDGDAILLAISTLYRIQGKLRKRFVVGTQLTGSRLQRELAFQNTALVRTEVGDKYVLDMLQQTGCVLGGERSGHILMLDRANTGDGLITALTLLEVKKTIGSLPRYVPYPVTEFCLPCPSPAEVANSAEFKAKVDEAQRIFGKKGRLTVRPSGTEPVIRISYECFSPSADGAAEKLKTFFLSDK